MWYSMQRGHTSPARRRSSSLEHSMCCEVCAWLHLFCAEVKVLPAGGTGDPEISSADCMRGHRGVTARHIYQSFTG